MGVETTKMADYGSLWLQAKVRERGLNDGLVCDVQRCWGSICNDILVLNLYL